MTKVVLFCLLSVMSLSLMNYGYNGSTTGAVVLAGGIIKAKHIVDNKKYKRKDCPVCKGKGWYISGDGIEKVKCGYCEEDVKALHPSLVPSKNATEDKERKTIIIRR